MDYREARSLLLARSHEEPAPYEYLDAPCRVWTGHCTPGGYGYLYHKFRKWLAHRLSFVAFNETEITEGKQINHHCDVFACLEPTHLYEGTQPENIEDMWERGRGSAVLNDEQVLEIKLLGIQRNVSGYQVAEQYGTVYTNIYLIWSCQAWARVAPELNKQLLQRQRINKVVTEAQIIQIRTFIQ
jgi:hypothetical protein